MFYEHLMSDGLSSSDSDEHIYYEDFQNPFCSTSYSSLLRSAQNFSLLVPPYYSDLSRGTVAAVCIVRTFIGTVCIN